MTAATSGTERTDKTSFVVIVTGSARGLGGGVSRLLLQQKANVVIGDTLANEGPSLAGEPDHPAAFRQHDVSGESAWIGLVGETVDQYGRLHALVNSGGIFVANAIVSLIGRSSIEFYR